MPGLSGQPAAEARRRPSKCSATLWVKEVVQRLVPCGHAWDAVDSAMGVPYVEADQGVALGCWQRPQQVLRQGDGRFPIDGLTHCRRDRTLGYACQLGIGAWLREALPQLLDIAHGPALQHLPAIGSDRGRRCPPGRRSCPGASGRRRASASRPPAQGHPAPSRGAASADAPRGLWALRFNIQIYR